MRSAKTATAAWTAAVLASLGLAGCGSTVQARGSVSGPGSTTGSVGTTGDQGIGATSGGVDLGGSPAGTTGTSGSGNGSGGLGTTGSSSSSGTGGATPGTPAVVVPQQGRYPLGVTATTVTIGTSYSSTNAGAQLGISGSTQGDVPSQYKALVKAINDRGGIAGRRLQLLIRDPGSTAQSSATAAQAECSYFTDDHPVFAILSSGGVETSRSCLAKKGVPLVVNQNVTRSNRDVFGRYPNYVEPISVNHDRIARPLLTALQRGGYFSGWNSIAGQPGVGAPVLGLMTFSGEQETAVKRSLLPVFAAAGRAIKSENTYYLTPPDGTANDAARAASAIQNAVIKFRNNGVTHVLFDDYGGTFSIFFTKFAESQSYFPRYGMTSQSAPQVFMTAGEISTKSMNGAVGLGQWPILDLRDEDNPVDGPYSNSARRTCEAFLKKAQVSWADANSHLVAMSTCDQIGLVASVLTRVGRDLTVNKVDQALDELGNPVLAANVATRIGAGHRDGAAAGYAFSYQPGCSCIRYTGARIDLG